MAQYRVHESASFRHALAMEGVDTDKLKEKVSRLSANKNAMKEAKAKIKKTTGRRRTRAAASTCGEFIDLVIFCEY